MLFVREDEDGIQTFIVCNNQGLCLIMTTDGAIAAFVEAHTKNLNPELRLNVGGDLGARKKKVFHHIRRYI